MTKLTLNLMVILAGLLVTGLLVAASSTLDHPTGDIIFSHALHVGEQEIECETCHATVSESRAALDRNLPDMDICANCHDVDDDETCGQCHRNPDEPGTAAELLGDLLFSHRAHRERKTDCSDCHGGIVGSEQADDHNWPGMDICFACHDDDTAPVRCSLCHAESIDAGDIHPPDWRHQHGAEAAQERSSCNGCHPQTSFCIDCHFGDNLDGSIHSLNYEFTHGLDVQNQDSDCSHCHDRVEFCNACHTDGRRMPLNHSRLAWPRNHGSAARADVEACASCHDGEDPTCSRPGCHRDSDGTLDTDPPIHSSNLGRFDSEGAWHSDATALCYQCHTNTRQAGRGFCGYCHGD